MKTWEFKFVQILPRLTVDDEEHLNRLGEIGWELVTVVHASEARLGMLFCFKRPRIDP